VNSADLIEQYRKAAMRHGDAVEKGKSKIANKWFDQGIRISHHFRRGGAEMQRAFMVLLYDINPWVRCRAATHSLEFAPVEALKALEQVAAGPPSLVQFNAEMVLREWRAGRLQIP
jgi:hypothetical protein